MSEDSTDIDGVQFSAKTLGVLSVGIGFMGVVLFAYGVVRWALSNYSVLMTASAMIIASLTILMGISAMLAIFE